MPTNGIESDQMKILINKENQVVANFWNGIPPKGVSTKFVNVMTDVGRMMRSCLGYIDTRKH